MTSGVLTDADHSGPDPDVPLDTEDGPPDTSATPPTSAVGVAEVVRRRLVRPARPTGWFWFAALMTTLAGGVLRLINLGHPTEVIFDETYYAEEAQDLLRYGVEWVPSDNGPQYVVHPPLGKWMIGLGEQAFGHNSFGWRISAVFFGTLSILLVILIAQRLFHSTVLACGAGLLMSLDGMHFVLSRVALLDIFLMFWLIAGVGCLVLDREQRRARWLTALEGGLEVSRRGAAGRPRLGVPWWRLGAAVCFGLAGGVKWSVIYYVLGFAVLVIVWEAGTRRSAGVRRPWRDALLDESLWMFGFLAVAAGTYLLTWVGWFASADGYFRHWYADLHPGHHEVPILEALYNLWHYHVEMYHFHTTLSSPHQYQSWPWQWLLLGRPVLFYWSTTGPCAGPNCASAILLLGTPLLWWSSIAALAGLAWLGIARRDWRASFIGLGVAAGILPWFWNELHNRTMFYFYALPAEPFLILAVVYVLGAIVGPARHRDGSGQRDGRSDRRLIGSVVAGVYVLLVAACFAYFYPIYTGADLTYAEWFARMWLGGRWI